MFQMFGNFGKQKMQKQRVNSKKNLNQIFILLYDNEINLMLVNTSLEFT